MKMCMSQYNSEHAILQTAEDKYVSMSQKNGITKP